MKKIYRLGILGLGEGRSVISAAQEYSSGSILRGEYLKKSLKNQ